MQGHHGPVQRRSHGARKVVVLGKRVGADVGLDGVAAVAAIARHDAERSCLHSVVMC